MIAKHEKPPTRPLGSPPAARELTAWIEILGCEAELERMLARLEAVRAGLALPRAGKRGAATAPAAELDMILGCLADHLHPAREVVRRFEESWARRLREVQAAGHARFRGFLADARGETLPVLRHLLGCPLCQRLARLVLFGFLPGATDPPKRRRRRRRRKPSTERQHPRGGGR